MDINTESLQSLYFDEDALIVQPAPLYRLNSHGDRYYYDFDENQEPVFYPSVTTVIGATLKKPEQLIKWVSDIGYQESKEYMEERAHYGTFLHTQLAKFIIEKSYDLDQLKELLKLYLEVEKLPSTLIYWHEELKEDMLCFAQFFMDYNVKPLAIEIVLKSKKGYAGALDLVCEMDFEEKGYWGEVYKSGERKGEPKETKQVQRITALIDFKSTKKGVFESAEIQLEAYKDMWNENFPDKPIDKMFNWMPKKWRGIKPTYTLTDQSSKVSGKKWSLLLEMYRFNDKKGDRDVMTTEGIIKLNEPLTANITNITLSELVKKKRIEKENEKKADEREDLLC